MTSEISELNFASRILRWLERRVQSNGLQEMKRIASAIGSTIGEVRLENQDCAVIGRLGDDIHEGSLLFAVLADGIGGMPNGAECSKIAIASFVARLVRSGGVNLEAKIKDAVHQANLSVTGKFGGSGGTTLVGVAITKHDSVGFSVGDSRLFHRSGIKVKQISHDDTIAGELKRIKGFSVEGESTNPLHKYLAQFIGMGDGVEARTYAMNEPEGSYILTSDGAHSVSFTTFQEVTGRAPTPLNIVSRVIQLSRWRGGDDNATVVVVPASPSREIDEEDYYLGLELWDSFGELQIIEVPIQPNRPIQNVASREPLESGEVESRSQKSPSTKPKGSSTKPKPNGRRKTSSKTKGTSRPSPRAQAELEVEIDVEGYGKQGIGSEVQSSQAESDNPSKNEERGELP